MQRTKNQETHCISYSFKIGLLFLKMSEDEREIDIESEDEDGNPR